MRQSNEVVDWGASGRKNGWGPDGYMLLIEPDAENGLFVVINRDLLDTSNLLAIWGKAVTEVARRRNWEPKLLKKHPEELERLLPNDRGNILVPQGTTVDVLNVERTGGSVVYGETRMLELAGVQVAVAA
jgi:hypothetical protein